MPGWHEFTREWRESGDLQVVGIVQEQHGDRARLFAQWQEFEWPILWDPFNSTGSSAVPFAVAVDEHGIVRKVNPKMDTFELAFLRQEFAPPEDSANSPAGTPIEAGARELASLSRQEEGTWQWDHHAAVSALLWRDEGALSSSVEVLEALASERPGNGTIAFHAGVARRMRYDSLLGTPEDFQAAIDHWTRALAVNPNQYIWRRRIQQYGPRMDKPYNFYRWIEQARKEVSERGEEPVPLRIQLTPAELAEPSRFVSSNGAVEPDPEAAIRPAQSWVSAESTVAFSTSVSSGGADGEKRRTASVHLAFRVDPARAVHWNNEAEAMVVWLGPGELLPGWTLSERLLEHPGGDEATSLETRRFSFDLELPEADLGQTLSGYALFNACEGIDGTCTYLRKEFEVRIGGS